jgi:hypothetical protein
MTFNIAQVVVHLTPFGGGFFDGLFRLFPQSSAHTSLAFLAHIATVLQSIMACRVFRQLKIGLITDFDSISVDSTFLQFAQRTSLMVVPTSERSIETPQRRPTNTEITRTTESQEGRGHEI